MTHRIRILLAIAAVGLFMGVGCMIGAFAIAGGPFSLHPAHGWRLRAEPFDDDDASNASDVVWRVSPFAGEARAPGARPL